MSEHKYALRLPEVLWLELRRAAALAGRSVNSEIVWRLSGGPLEPVEMHVTAKQIDEDAALVERVVGGVDGDGLRPAAVPTVGGGGDTESGNVPPAPVAVSARPFTPDFGKRLKP